MLQIQTHGPVQAVHVQVLQMLSVQQRRGEAKTVQAAIRHHGAAAQRQETLKQGEQDTA